MLLMLHLCAGRLIELWHLTKFMTISIELSTRSVSEGMKEKLASCCCREAEDAGAEQQER
jgi:hypothetical protein